MKITKTNLTKLLDRFIRREPPPQKTTLEEAAEIIEKADRFDKLIFLPGWQDALEFLANDVQLAITEATKYLSVPEQAKVYVTIWNAKRDMLDNLIGYINQIRQSRDEIAEQFKKERTNEQYAGGPAH